MEHRPSNSRNQGKIAYADDLLDSWKKNGIYDDFFHGLVDTMKTDDGYAAVPYNLDVRISWYNKTLLEAAGVEPPTDWDSYRNVCAASRRTACTAYGLGSGAGSFTGSHVLIGVHDQQRRRTVQRRHRSRTVSHPRTSRPWSSSWIS